MRFDSCDNIVQNDILEKGSSKCESTKDLVIRSYKRRFWMLALFSVTSFLGGLLYPLYASMADMNSCYYGVTMEAINWTGMLFMIVYLVFIGPASKFIEYIDLRWTVILSCVCNLIACAVQFAGVSRDSFAYVMVSVLFASLCNLFVLGVPPFIAARWYPNDELSRACAFGVFGNQFGVAVGFLYPALFIPSDCKQTDGIARGKFNVAIVLTAIHITLLLLILFTFENAPPHPPSLSQTLKQSDVGTEEKHLRVLIRFLKNKDFILVLLMYGLTVSTYFTVITTLSDMVSRYFKNRAEGIGLMGFLLVVAGLVGSIIAGYILDRTHRFKETSLAMNVLSLVFHIIFSALLYVNIFWVQYITISIYGFFLTSFLSVGFEYGVEVTYPDSESVCGCLMNASTMLFGIIQITIQSHLLQDVGPLVANVAPALALVISCVITGFITTDYKRSSKNLEIVS